MASSASLSNVLNRLSKIDEYLPLVTLSDELARIHTTLPDRVACCADTCLTLIQEFIKGKASFTRCEQEGQRLYSHADELYGAGKLSFAECHYLEACARLAIVIARDHGVDSRNSRAGALCDAIACCACDHNDSKAFFAGQDKLYQHLCKALTDAGGTIDVEGAYEIDEPSETHIIQSLLDSARSRLSTLAD